MTSPLQRGLRRSGHWPPKRGIPPLFVKIKLVALLEVEKILGYEFEDKNLLFKALTHKSVDPIECYEKLEFIGDGLWTLLVSEYAYRHIKDIYEMAKARGYLISAKFQAHLCVIKGIHKHIKTKKTPEEISEKIKADVIEALLGGIYIDAKYDLRVVKEVFLKTFGDEISKALKKRKHLENYKTILANICKQQNKPLPVYKVIGLDGLQVLVQCNALGIKEYASGENEFIAQQNCAKRILKKLQAI